MNRLRKRQLRKLIGMLVFILVVAVSGYALSASGNLRNPLTVFSEISATISGSSSAAGGQQRAGGPPAGANQDAPPSGDRGGGGENQTTFQWSQIGGVLFNLWFIAAAAAVVMLLGPVIGFGMKQFQRAIRRETPSRAPA